VTTLLSPCLLEWGRRATHEASQAPVAQQPTPDYSSPAKTYKIYLEAIKADDLEAARMCWVISDNNKSGVLDVIVGTWISAHRLNKLVTSKLGIRLKRFSSVRDPLENLARGDCTDEALERTLKRLSRAQVEVSDGTAELLIKWQKGDGYPNDAFGYSEESIRFRRVGKDWKIDANRETGLDQPSDFFTPGSWGPMFRDRLKLTNQIVAGIESGRLGKVDDVRKEIEKQEKLLLEKYEAKKEKNRSGK